MMNAGKNIMEILPAAGAMKRPETGERNFNEVVKQNQEYLNYGQQFNSEVAENRSLTKDDVVGRKINQYGQKMDD